MKINDQQKLLEAYAQSQTAQNNKQPQDVQSVQQEPATDRVEISNGSKFLIKVNEAMKADDPERATRMQMIKEQVQNGSYKVDPEKVANAMMKDLIKDLG